VIDWTNTGAGDPRLDAARTVAILSAAALPDTELGYDEMEELRSQLIDGWEAGYEAEAGSIEALRPFLVWAATVTIDDLARKPAGLPGIALMIERLRALRGIWSGDTAEADTMEEFDLP